MTVRLFVTADNHLNRFMARMTVARLEERRRRLRLAFRQVVDAAIEANATALILGGDTFDAVDPRNLERAAFARMLRRLRDAGVTVVATGGNHDSPKQTTDHGGYGPYAEFEEAGLLQYLGIPENGVGVKHVIVQADKQVIAIAGSPWRPATDGDPLAGVTFPSVRHAVSENDPGREPDWRIFVTHASIEGHTYPGPLEPVVRRQTIADLEADILVVGHVHQSFVSVIPCRSGRQCHVVVPGSTERMTFGEGDVRPGYVVIDLPRHGTLTVSRRSISPQARVALDIPSTEITPVSLGGLRADSVEATASVVQRLREVADADAMATLRIHGPALREVLDEFRLAEVQEFGANAFFSFDLDASGLIPADIGAALSPAGERRSAVEEVRATIDSMAAGASIDERAVLEEAWARIVPILGEYGGDDRPALLSKTTATPDGPQRTVT
jgi:DNA repair exonuclease SbcCD nuclease subunit